MPNKLRDPHDPARVLDDDGHPLAVIRNAPSHGPTTPHARSKSPARRLEDATVRALVDDLEAVVTMAPTTPATRSRVQVHAQSEAGGRSGSNRAAVRALLSAYYADDGGRRLFELLDAAHAKAITPGGQRDRQELFRQLAGAPDTSAPEPEGDEVRMGRSLRAELRAALRGGAGAFLDALEGES